MMISDDGLLFWATLYVHVCYRHMPGDNRTLTVFTFIFITD